MVRRPVAGLDARCGCVCGCDHAFDCNAMERGGSCQLELKKRLAPKPGLEAPGPPTKHPKLMFLRFAGRPLQKMAARALLQRWINRARPARSSAASTRAAGTMAVTDRVVREDAANGSVHIKLNRPEALNALDEGEPCLRAEPAGLCERGAPQQRCACCASGRSP